MTIEAEPADRGRAGHAAPVGRVSADARTASRFNARAGVSEDSGPRA